MKTAISISDKIFDAAEQLAKSLKMSRSELYSIAISDFILKHRNKGVTDALNKIYAEEESSIDPIVNAIQLNSLPREEW